MKTRVFMLLAGCMPILAAADIVGSRPGNTDFSLVGLIASGFVALLITRRLLAG